MKKFYVAILFSLLATISSSLQAAEAPPQLGTSYEINPNKVSDAPSERIDPFTGTVSYEVLETMLPGDGGMDIIVSRAFNKNPYPSAGSAASAYNWEISVPRIYMNATVTSNACQNPNPGTALINGNFVARPYLGITLTMPMESVRSFVRQADNTWITNDLWKADCIATSDGKAGNGFRVTAPDGRVIFFTENYIPQGNVATLTYNPQQYVPSKMRDRNGNEILYTYVTDARKNRHVQKIYSTDGREVVFTYETAPGWTSGANILRLLSFTNGTGTWTYQYASNGLLSVVQPGGGTTSYTYNGNPASDLFAQKVNIASVTHPNGHKVSYTYITRTWKYSIGSADYENKRPAVSKRTIEYPEFTTRTDDFTYTTPVAGQQLTQMQSNNNQEWRKITVDNTSGANRGRVLREEIGKQTKVDQTTVFGYTTVRKVGSYIVPGPDAASAENLVRANSRTITRGTNTYTTTLTGFDDYGNPSQMSEDGPDISLLRSQSFGDPAPTMAVDTAQRSRTLQWVNDTSTWVLSQLKKECIDTSLCNEFTYDGLTRLTGESRLGVTKSYEYDGRGNISAVTDGAGYRYQYLDYYRGLPRREVIPDGTTSWTRVVRSDGLVQSETNANLKTTSYQYDGLGREIQRVEPLPRGTVNSVWTPSTRTETYVSAGLEKTFRFDHLGEVYEERDKDVVSGITRQQMTYRKLVSGNIAQFRPWHLSSDLAPWITIRTIYHDSLNRLEVVEEAGYTRWHSYQAGNRVTTVSEDNSLERIAYKSFGDPSEQYPVSYRQSTDPIPSGLPSPDDAMASATVTDIWRDGLGRPLSVVRYLPAQLGTSHPSVANALAKKITYGPYGKPQTIADASRSSPVVFTYNGNGDVAKRVEGNRDIRFEYNTAGRLVKKYAVGEPATQTVTTYDPVGNILSLTKGSLVWNYTYFDDNSLKTEELVTPQLDTFNAPHYTAPVRLKYEYTRNLLGNISSIKYPSGTSIALNPNAWGWPTTVGTYVSDIRYYATGKPSQYSFGAGHPTVTQARTWRNQISQVLAAGIVNRSYTYTPSSNIATTTDGLLSQTTQFAYDQSGRLTKSTRGTAINQYSYDYWDNLTSSLEAGITYSSPVAAASHQPTAFGVNNFGEVTSVPAVGLTVTYDGIGDAVGITSSVGTGTPLSTDLRFDSKGKLTRQRSSDNILNVYARINEHVVAEVQSTASALTYTENIYLGQRRVAQHRYFGSTAWTKLALGGSAPTFSKNGEERLDIFHDLLDSTVAVRNHDTGVVKQVAYSDWGKVAATAFSGDDSNLLFTGQQTIKLANGDTLMFAGGSRLYYPREKRFLSPDPLTSGMPTGRDVNHYVYANNNPNRFVDKNGNSPLDIGFLAVDLVRFGAAVVTGGDVLGTGIDVGIGIVGVLSPVPGTGVAIKAQRAVSAATNVEKAGQAFARAAQLKKNAEVGRRAEKVAQEQLVKDGYEILGTQVTFKTELGTRRVDILAKGPDSKIYAVEVKANNASKPAIQQQKDDLIQQGAATMTSRKPGVQDVKGEQIQLKDITVKIDP